MVEFEIQVNHFVLLLTDFIALSVILCCLWLIGHNDFGFQELSWAVKSDNIKTVVKYEITDDAVGITTFNGRLTSLYNITCDLYVYSMMCVRGCLIGELLETCYHIHAWIRWFLFSYFTSILFMAIRGLCWWHNHSIVIHGFFTKNNPISHGDGCSASTARIWTEWKAKKKLYFV